MLFLLLFTPAAAPGGPASAKHMAEIGTTLRDDVQGRRAVSTGGIKSRNTGMKIARRHDRITVEEGPVAGSSPTPAAGYALLRAGSREELVRHVQKFLQNRRGGNLRDHRGDGAHAAAGRRRGVIAMGSGRLRSSRPLRYSIALGSVSGPSLKPRAPQPPPCRFGGETQRQPGEVARGVRHHPPGRGQGPGDRELAAFDRRS